MTPTRELPASVESERSVLGSVLVNPDNLSLLASELSVDDFILPVHRDIFDAMLETERIGRKADFIEVEEQMRRASRPLADKGYWLTLAGAYEIPEMLPQHIGKIQEKSLARRIIAGCADAAGQAYGGTETTEVLDRLWSLCSKLSTKTQNSLVHVGEIVPRFLDVLEERAKNKRAITGVQTGIHDLDLATGGLQNEELVVIAARPGVGKTAWAMQIAALNAIVSNGSSCVFSLEMSAFGLLERQVANMLMFDAGKLKHGDIEYADWKKIHGAMSKMSNSSLYYDDRSITLRSIQANARKWRIKHQDKQGLVVVDYLQLTEGVHGQNRERTIADISRGLKQLARELKLPVIAVSQLNRGSDKEEREPRLSDLRESGAIEQDADIVIFPHNPDKVVDGLIDIILAKNRNGQTGKFQAEWVGRHFLFRNP